MAKAGRKGWKEELDIGQRYADLSEPAFKVLKQMLNSKDKNDKKWAVEQLSKGFQKMIPQDITSGGEPLTITFHNAVATQATRGSIKKSV